MLIWSLSLFAPHKALPQETGAAYERVEMADRFRAEGKIYVVVAIIAIVLGGLIVYAFSIDRKISRLEKQFEGDSKRNQK